MDGRHAYCRRCRSQAQGGNPWNVQRSEESDAAFVGMVPRIGRGRHEAQPEDWRPTSQAEWSVTTSRGVVCVFTAWYRPGTGYVWSQGTVWYAAEHAELDRAAKIVRYHGYRGPFKSIAAAMSALRVAA